MNELTSTPPTTAMFMGVEMDAATAAKLSELPAAAALNTSVTADVDRAAIDERLSTFLGKASTFMTKQLAQSALLPSDLARIRYTIADDGKCYADYQHAGRARNGTPSERFGGFTQSVLKAHGVVGFVKCKPAKNGGWLKTDGEIATDGAGICTVESIPFAGQAKHDADANHASAGCARSKCTVANHGDNADRLTWNQRSALGENGWHVEYADGTRENVSALEWDNASA